MKLEEISAGASLEGVEPTGVVTVPAATILPPDSPRLVYRIPDGALRERLLVGADDSGACKTIMAGIYIRELIIRADARRALSVAPGCLVEQWRDEQCEQCGLEFRNLKELELASPSGKSCEDVDHLIIRMDQISGAKELDDELCAASWDLVVFNEAHKLSVHFFGEEIGPLFIDCFTLDEFSACDMWPAIEVQCA